MARDAAALGRARQRTGRLGQGQVETLFIQMDLTPRTELWDDGEDCNVEFTRADGRWERVFVQVKGTEAGFPTARDGTWSVRLKANAVARYRRAAHPVVLVAVDVRTGECRWDDLRALASAAPGPVTLRVPTGQRLAVADRAAFVGRLGHLADAMRAEVLPAPNALALEEARLRTLDPRLGVRLTATSGAITREIWAASGSPELQMQGELTPEFADLMDAHIRYGTPVTAEFRNFSVTGSPLFEELGVAPIALIELVSPGSVHQLALGWLDADGAFQCAVEGPAVGYAGQEGLEVRLEGAALPVAITIRGATGPLSPGQRRTLTGSFRFQFGGWDGHLYRKLPWWDSVYAFLQALAGGAMFALARREFGQYVDLSTFQVTENLQAFARKALAGLGPLPTIVAAARRCASDHCWREGVIPHDEIQRWARVARILQGEAVALAPRPWVLQGIGELPDDQEVALAHLISPIRLPLMGESIGQLEVVWRLANYRLERDPDSQQVMLTPMPTSTAHAVLHDPSIANDDLVASAERRVLEQA
ncbi:DUF4365 domain-containing protein [Dyella japonica]|nr:DUF4365 domain-containing protein [Dyella japonica]